MIANVFKAAGILIEDEKLLVTKSYGKDVFVSPGGKIEKGESPTEALIRELKEELSIRVAEADLSWFGDYEAVAAGTENVRLQMRVYLVKKYTGEIRVGNEIEEIAWIDSSTKLKVGSIFEHEVIPALVKRGLLR